MSQASVSVTESAPARPSGSRQRASASIEPVRKSHPAAVSDLETPAFLGVRRRSRSLSVAVRVTVPLLLLFCWWYGSSSGHIPASVLASPKDVVLAFIELEQTGQLREFLLASLTRAGLGVFLGVSVGLALGTLSGLSTLAEELVDPTLQMLRAVPFLAVVPLFISWFGIDEKFKVVLIAAACVFPMYAYSYLGVRS